MEKNNLSDEISNEQAIIKKVNKKKKIQKEEKKDNTLCDREKLKKIQNAFIEFLSKLSLPTKNNKQSYSQNPMALLNIPQRIGECWLINPNILNMYSIIEKWFKFYAKPLGLKNRKCLCIFSKLNLNQVQFAKSLLKDESLYAIYDKEFNNKEINPKIKLLILNEFKTFNKINKEQWKKLFTGKEAEIKLYDGTTFIWKYKVPCLILTSNLDQLAQLYLEYSKEILFQEVIANMSEGELIKKAKEDYIRKKIRKVDENGDYIIEDKCSVLAAFSESMFRDLYQRENDEECDS